VKKITEGLKSFYVAHKRTLFFISKFLLLIVFLNLCAKGYIGLVDPKGSYYSPFLSKFDLIDFITQGIIYPVKWLMALLGYTIKNHKNSIYIVGSHGVAIYYPCLGIGIMIVLVSFILSYPVRKEKIKFILGGLIGIHIINIARIFTILTLNYKYPSSRINTHEYFNYIAWVLVLLLIYLYARVPSKKIEE
jgi:exosortase/archaeosortase family protein